MYLKFVKFFTKLQKKKKKSLTDIMMPKGKIMLLKLRVRKKGTVDNFINLILDVSFNSNM